MPVGLEAAALSSMTVDGLLLLCTWQNLRLFRVRIITWQHKSVACQQAHTQTKCLTGWQLISVCVCVAAAAKATLSVSGTLG